jgi:hypothetical protein
MSLESRGTTEEAAITACLERMRAKVTRLEKAAPGLIPLTLEVRHEMMELISHVRALRTTHAAARMIGAEPPLTQQAPVEELPIFAHGHVLTADEIEAMQQTLHRAGDWTQDRSDSADCIDEEVRP